MNDDKRGNGHGEENQDDQPPGAGLQILSQRVLQIKEEVQDGAGPDRVRQDAQRGEEKAEAGCVKDLLDDGFRWSLPQVREVEEPKHQARDERRVE